MSQGLSDTNAAMPIAVRKTMAAYWGDRARALVEFKFSVVPMSPNGFLAYHSQQAGEYARMAARWAISVLDEEERKNAVRP